MNTISPSSPLTTDSAPIPSRSILADYPHVSAPIQVIKLISHSNGGVDIGVAIAGFQALNFVGPATNAHAVTITGTENRGSGRFRPLL